MFWCKIVRFCWGVSSSYGDRYLLPVGPTISTLAPKQVSMKVITLTQGHTGRGREAGRSLMKPGSSKSRQGGPNMCEYPCRVSGHLQSRMLCMTVGLKFRVCHGREHFLGQACLSSLTQQEWGSKHKTNFIFPGFSQWKPRWQSLRDMVILCFCVASAVFLWCMVHVWTLTGRSHIFFLTN